MSTSTPEQVFFALLSRSPGVAAIAGTRVYPQLAPENVQRPYCILGLISGGQEHHMRGASGAARARVQVDSYADTYAAAKALGRAVRMSLDGYQADDSADGAGGSLENVRVWLVSDSAELDMPASGKGRGVHRVIQDYEVVYTDEVPTLV